MPIRKRSTTKAQEIRRKRINDSRYGKNYPYAVKTAHVATDGKCCLCLSHASEEIHHAMYRDVLGSIKDREIPGIHIFPLCKRCHEIAHLKTNWLSFPARPSYNRNKEDFVSRLTYGYRLLSTQAREKQKKKQQRYGLTKKSITKL